MAGKKGIRESKEYKEVAAYLKEKEGEKGNFISATPLLAGLADAGLGETALEWLYHEMEAERANPTAPPKGQIVGFLAYPPGIRGDLKVVLSYQLPKVDEAGAPGSAKDGQAEERAKKIRKARGDGSQDYGDLPEKIAEQLKYAEISLDSEENPTQVSISLKLAREAGKKQMDFFKELATAANVLTTYVETGEVPQSAGEKLLGFLKIGGGRYGADRTKLPGRYGPDGDGRPRC